MIAILGSLWPFLLAGAGLLFGVFSHFKAKSDTATANAVKADAGKQVAEAQTAVAQSNDAAAQANATAAQAGADSLKEKVNVTNDVAAMPAGSAADELRGEWSKD